MEITVIDDSDVVGWAASATRMNEVYMTDVESMVRNVIAAAKKKKITRLNILDHGSPYGFQIGTDRITVKTFARYRTGLRKLSGHFAPGAIVHLQHCKIGQNKDLLKKLASLLGVTVYAGTGLHNPVYRFNLGDYLKCTPTGQCDSTARP